jgi:hypothetical protein
MLLSCRPSKGASARSIKGHPYNDVVTNAPADEHSAEYIDSMIQAGTTAGFGSRVALANKAKRF